MRDQQQKFKKLAFKTKKSNNQVLQLNMFDRVGLGEMKQQHLFTISESPIIIFQTIF